MGAQIMHIGISKIWFSNDIQHHVRTFCLVFQQSNQLKTQLLSILDNFIHKHKFYLFIKQSMLAKTWFSNGPDHWKTEQNGGHFVNHEKTEHHWRTEQSPTI